MNTQKVKLWIGRGIYSLATRAVIVVLSFANIFFLVRIVDKQSFGAWILFNTVTSLLEMTRQGFIKNPFIGSWTSGNNEERKHVLTSSISLNIIITSLFVVGIILMAPLLSKAWQVPLLAPLLNWYSLISYLMIPYFYFDCLLTIRLNFKAVFIVELIRHGCVSLFLAVTFFFASDLDLMMIIWMQLAGLILSSLYGYLQIRHELSITILSKSTMKALVKFGKYTLGTNLSSMIIKNTDTWLLAKLASPAAVAIYNPALRIANIFEVPALAVSTMVFPKVHSKMKNEGKAGIKELYEHSVSLMLALILPIALPIILLAEPITILLFGKDYVESATILQITMLFSLIIPFNRQFGTIMDGLKKPKLNFLFLLITVFLNLLFTYAGFKLFGIIGCAIGTLLSFIVVFIANQIVLYKVFAITISSVLQRIWSWYQVFWSVLSKEISRLYLPGRA